MASAVINNLIAYKVLYMLVTPFAETEAYKLGIIDEKGKNLIKPSQFTTSEQKDAYTYLHRLVFNMKRILSKLPGTESKLKSIVAALYLIKEYYSKNDKQLSLMEERFNDLIKKDVILAEEQVTVEKWVESKELDEDGAPTNSTGAATSTDAPAIRKKDIEKYKKNNAGVLNFTKRMNKQL